MPRFKVVNVDNKITRAIGKKQNLLGLSDNKDTVIFLKNRFDYNNNEKNILSRLNSQLDVGKEIQQFRDDLFVSLTNINSLQGVNSQLPTIDDNVLRGLVDLNVNLKNEKKTKFFLEKISDTQKKIYKVLSKIQEDLIDEQDTRIKEAKSQKADESKSVPTATITKPLQKGTDVSVPTEGINLKTISDIAKALSSAGSKLIKIAGKVFKAAEVILLLYYIAYNWSVAEKSIDSPGIIEKIIFAIFAGTTEWVKTHLDLLSWIVDNYLEVCEWIKNNLPDYVDFLGDYKAIVQTLVKAIDYTPIHLVCEYCLKPVFDWLKTNGEYGIPVGVYAVQFYRSIKDKFTNNIPNGTTYELLFGENKPLEKAIGSGVYVWNKLGKSTLKGSARDLAKALTTEELENIRKHDDIDESDLKKIEDALNIKKAENITDVQIEERRKIDTGLESLTLEISNNVSKLSDSWKKLWLTLAQTAQEFVLDNPTSTVITFFTANGKPATLNQNHLLYENTALIGIDKSTDAPMTLCEGIIKDTKIKFNSENEIFWFTPYGSVIIQYTVTDPIRSKRMIDSNTIKNPKLVRGYLLNVYRVMGYYTPSFKFIRDVFNPDDIVFKKIFKYNIITNSDVNYATKISKTEFKASGDTDKNTYTSTVKMIPNMSPISPSTNEPYKIPLITPTDTKRTVWDFFKNEMGLKDYQIAGIMGNIEAETGFLPKNIQGEHFDRSKSGKNDGMSGGLCQWHDVGGKGRLSKLKKFASSMGRDWRDLDVQLLFLKHELETTHKKALKGILDSRNVEEATRAWVYHYEKPADMEGETRRRTASAHGYMNTFSLSGMGDISSSNNREFYQNDVNTSRNDTDTGVDEGKAPSPNGSGILNDARSMIQGTTYSQDRRTREGYYDCSSFVTDVLKRQGYKINGVPTTHHYDNVLKSIGFERVGYASANDKRNLQPGDILLKKKKHIMIYNGNGTVIEANGYNNKNYNGINAWNGSIHKSSDIYEVWRAGTNVSVSPQESFNPPQSNARDVTEIASNDIANNTSSRNTVNVNLNNTRNNEYEYLGMSEELFKFKLDVLA
jgi:cell wall-associated NlpC family hydrolase